MTKAIVFDMDGTIANLYKVPKWEQCLRLYDESPYIKAKKMYKKTELYPLLGQLKKQGYKIVITSWLSKFSTKEYDKRVRQAKKDWLEKMKFPCDEVHIVKYGTNKHSVTKQKYQYQILIDDNDKVRKGWSGAKAIHPNDMITELQQLLTIG